MIDVFNLPDNSMRSQVFYPLSSGSTQWQTWQKPAGAKMVYFYLLGSGGGGGGGRTGAVNTGTGGGGGGSSAITIGLFPACFLPVVLYISVGKGGLGGAAGVAGGNGELSYVSVSATTNSSGVLLQSGAAAAGGSLYQGNWNFSTSSHSNTSS